MKLGYPGLISIVKYQEPIIADLHTSTQKVRVHGLGYPQALTKRTPVPAIRVSAYLATSATGAEESFINLVTSLK
jgi:hypothetical protein